MRGQQIFKKFNVSQLFLVGAVLAAFSPVLNFGYLNWDDYQHFCSNPLVYSLSWNNLLDLFQQTPNHTYIPLTVLSFNLEYHLFGLSGSVAHAINVFLHAAVGLVIYYWALDLKFTTWQAWMAAALFTLHPMHVESVAWVTERKDVLSVLFYFLGLKYYGTYIQRRSGKDYAWSLVFGFLSILAKPMAVSLPWVLFLLDWYYQRRPGKMMVMDKLPFAVLILPIAAITLLKLSPHPDIGPHSVLVGVWSLAWYLEKFLWPAPLLPAYTPPLPMSLANSAYWTSVLVVLAFAALIYLRRKDRLLIFAALFWLATIFIFWRFDFKDNNIVADRFMYLPSLGFCLYLGRYLSNTKVLAAALAVVLGLMSFRQCFIWRNDLTLWSWTLKHDPKNIIAKENLSSALYDTARPRTDYARLTRAIDQGPFTAKNYFDRGRALMQEQDYYLAFSDFDRALRLDPAYDMAYVRRGQLYVLKGDLDHALEDFDKAIALNPANALAYLQGSTVFLAMRQDGQALDWLKKAQEADASLGGIYFQRGLIYDRQGQYQKAVDEYTKGLPLYRDLKSLYERRAVSYEALKNYDKAEDDFQKSIQEDPYDLRLLNELGTLYLKKGNDEMAMTIFNKIIALYPFYDNAYNNRGIVDLHFKQYRQALQDYSEAIRLALYPYHALITRGDLYLALGDPAKARQDYAMAALMADGDSLARLKLDHLDTLHF